MTEENDPMELWNKVCKTDPDHTKKVSFGRGFTAIDPMYQIRCATEQFGVVGVNWGWKVEQIQYLTNNTVAILLSFWVGAPQDFIQQWGQSKLYTDKANSIPDIDCMKKATTDAITKCLSYYGFNADVFLGQFDDNKYVEGLKKEKVAEKERSEDAEVKQIVERLGTIETAELLDTYKGELRLKWNSYSQLSQQKLSTAVSNAEERLGVKKA